MNTSDLRESLSAVAAQAPRGSDVKAAFTALLVHRRRRRAWQAAAGIAATVVVLTVLITAVARQPRSMPPVTVSPPSRTASTAVATTPDVSIRPSTAFTPTPLGANLETFRAEPMYSPIAPANGFPTVVNWTASGTNVAVAWGGSLGSRPEFVSVANGTPSTPAATGPQPMTWGVGVDEGFIVDSAAALITHDPDVGFRTASATVNGHPAAVTSMTETPVWPTNRAPEVLSTDPGARRWYQLGISAASWVSWQLPDGRYVHAWKSNADDKALLAFADSLVEKPVLLAQPFVPRVTVKGYREEIVTHDADLPVSSFSVQLCPAHPNPVILAAGRRATPSGQADSDGACLILFADPTTSQQYESQLLTPSSAQPPLIQTVGDLRFVDAKPTYANALRADHIFLSSWGEARLSPTEWATVFDGVQWTGS